MQRNRLERIFQNAREEPDVVAIVNGAHVDPNFFYVTGYRNGLFESSTALLFRDMHVEVITTTLEEDAASQKNYVVHVPKDQKEVEQRKILRTVIDGARKIGINFQGISHKDYLQFRRRMKDKKFLDVSDALTNARLLKDDAELEAISKAAGIISEVVTETPNLVRQNMKEKELKAEIDYLMMKKGANSPSFDSIVAFGENSALPHYTPGERKLRKGDNILVDVGAKYDLYCSDITRTFFYGAASPEQKEMYGTVLDAQERALGAIREGSKAKDVHNLAFKVIGGSKFKGRFTHSLGHSIGLEVHDSPGRGLSSGSRLTLKTNMVMTVEPGVYLPGMGGVRIEDDVLVTKEACRVITRSPKELMTI